MTGDRFGSIRRAIFLDRDGTLIVEKHYLHDLDLVELESGAVSGLRRLAAEGYALIGVTNQSGVGRGRFGIEAVHAVNARVDKLLRPHAVAMEAWYVCPHAPDHNCDCRKPAAGLPQRAATDRSLDLESSWVIGDKASDVLLADAIGGRGILVMTGHGERDRGWAARTGRLVAPNLDAAAELIMIASARAKIGDRPS